VSEHVVPRRIDSQAIRRRLAREYVVLTAPAELDVRAALDLLDGLAEGTDADVVIDLRAVEACDPAVVHVLVGAARSLEADGAALTLSHPSPACEAVLADEELAAVLSVRRPRSARPLRHSMRGEVGQI
jgi:anti-anti-sigma regulatory factor